MEYILPKLTFLLFLFPKLYMPLSSNQRTLQLLTVIGQCVFVFVFYFITTPPRTIRKLW